MIDEYSNIIVLHSISIIEMYPVNNQIPKNVLSNYTIPHVTVVNLIQTQKSNFRTIAKLNTFGGND
jgi:hypothetical protein